MRHEPTPDDIDSLLEQVDDETPWSAVDWDYETGMYDEPTLSVELHWNALDALDGDGDVRGEILTAIETSPDPEGAPRDEVVSIVVESVDDADAAVVKDVLERLQMTGEVYEPKHDHLRRA